MTTYLVGGYKKDKAKEMEPISTSFAFLCVIRYFSLLTLLAAIIKTYYKLKQQSINLTKLKTTIYLLLI